MDGNTLAMIKALGGSGSVEDLTTSGGAADAGKVLVVGNDGSISAETISGETVIDSTLAIQGAAADAKATGDAIALVNESLQTKAGTSVATTSANGLMSSTDKTRLDALYADYSSAITALGVSE